MSSENATYYSRSMSGIVELTDGTTTITDGAIVCDSLTTNTLNTTNFNATTLSDGYCTINLGNITGVNNLYCSYFSATTFNATNLAGSTVTVNDTLSFTGNTGLSHASVKPDLTNKYLTETINTTYLSNGWLWKYSPTNTSCMLFFMLGT